MNNLIGINFENPDEQPALLDFFIRAQVNRHRKIST